MATKTIKAKFQIRKDTSANWTSANPVLKDGEIAYDTTNKRFKIGDGTTAWNSLGFASSNALSHLGVTATAAELNVLDGITATTTELNYVDGVTSNIQTQLDGKASTSHGTHVTFTTTTPKAAGTAAAGSATTVSRSDHVHPVQTTVSGNAGTATKLKTARTIELTGDVTGSGTFDGSANLTIEATVADDSHNHSNYASSGHTHTIKQDGVTGLTANRYATCSTASSTAAKTASITSGTFTLETGSKVTVKFANANSASTPTLNINSTGAKNIYHKGSKITTGTNKALLAGAVDLVYDGTGWNIIGNYVDTNTTYSSKDAASGGTTTSLVTTGEKYTWNNKQNALTAGTNISISDNTISANYPTASTSQAGAIKVALVHAAELTGVNSATDESGRYYPIQLNGDGVAVVNVPWENDNTTYSAATTSAAGLMSAADKTKLDGIATGANNYSLPLSTSSVRGGMKIGYTASGANIPVQLSSEKAYVALTKSAVTSALGYTPPTTNTTYSTATTSAAGLLPSPGTSDPEQDTFILVAGTAEDGVSNPYWTTGKLTDTTYSAAGTALGLVKSGGDVTIASGVITVNDDSHNHTIANIDNLQSSLDNLGAAIPTKVSQLTNDSGFTTNTGTVTSVKVAAGTGLSVDNTAAITTSGTRTLSLAESGVTAGSYGPSAAVTGNNNTTMSVPYITVDKYGRVTSISNKTYTAKNTTYSAATYSSLGLLKPAYTSTNAVTLTTSAASNTNTPTIAAKTTTSGRYYAVEADKNGVAYVNVPWTNTTYTFNGAVSTIKDSNLNASRVLISDENGKVAASGITAEKLQHLHNVTGDIQTQLDNKVSNSDFADLTATVGTKADSDHTHDYSSTYAAKSHSHSSYVNQNAFSNVKAGSTTIAADTTTDTLEIAAGTGISVSGDATNDKVTITNSGVRSISTGSNNGTISVNTNGTSAEVAVKGLGSAAYTASTAYAAASHGTHVTADTVKSALGTSSTGTGFLKQDGTWATPTNTTYSLVGANGTTGLVKNGSSVTSTSGLTACPIISGVPYYKDTNTQSAYGNITTSGTITSTAVTSATGVLVYDSDNKIQRATAANLRTIIGAGTSNLAIGNTSTTAAAGNHTHDYSNTYAAKSHTHSNYAASNHTHPTSLTVNESAPADYTQLYHGGFYTLSAGGSNLNFALPSQDHSKTSVTAGTAGTSSATSGSTLAVPYITVNANGHVTGYGTHTHTISGFAASNHTHTGYAASDHTHSGYASSSHSHNYAGSSSAGGAATSANKVNSNLVVKLNSGTTEGTNLFTFNGSAAKTINITPSAIGAAASSHTHSGYASSSHTHTGYASSTHTHTEYASSSHTHSDYVSQANMISRVYTYNGNYFYLQDNNGNTLKTITKSSWGATAAGIMEGFRNDIFEMGAYQAAAEGTSSNNQVIRAYFLPGGNSGFNASLQSALESVLSPSYEIDVDEDLDCFIVEAIGSPHSAAECTLIIKLLYRSGEEEEARIICNGGSYLYNSFTWSNSYALTGAINSAKTAASKQTTSIPTTGASKYFPVLAGSQSTTGVSTYGHSYFYLSSRRLYAPLNGTETAGPVIMNDTSATYGTSYASVYNIKAITSSNYSSLTNINLNTLYFVI